MFISLDAIQLALAAQGMAILSMKPVQNGMQLKVQGGSITAFENGNAIVQGKEQKAIEAALDVALRSKNSTSSVFHPDLNFSGNKSVNVSQQKAQAPYAAPAPLARKRVFIVHGHERSTLLELTNFLFRNNYDPVVLSEEVDGGDTIIEKLERVFQPDHDIAAAIVLATPDDEYNNGQIARCRPNVELELGFVIAHLTRRKLVYLRKAVLENVTFVLPSDVQGVVYQSFSSLNNVENKILTELAHITRN